MTPSPRAARRPAGATDGVPGGLATAREALAAGDWAAARESFAALAAEGAGAPAFEGLAEAAWWLDDGATCLAARESAHRARLDAGDLPGAAGAATALGYDAALFGQGAAVAQGWLGRARAQLDTAGGTLPEHGWLAVREAELALHVTHRPDAARAAAAEAVDIARALGLADLELVGAGLIGLADVSAGRVEEGLHRLDAAVTGALAGDVPDVMWVGKLCCWLVVACRLAQDLPRAVEWCRRVDDLCRDRDLAPLFTACRIQYAAVRLASGHWLEAEQELVQALDRMRGSRRASRTEAVVQLGHLRRRQNRLDEAEELYAQAGYAPEAMAGRALVRLARGEVPAAWALACSVLDDVPVSDRLTRSTVLLPVVRCAVAAGHGEAAAAAARELGTIAADSGSEGMRGMAAVAEALVAEPAEAPTAWRTAARCFHRAGLPVDEADAHEALASVLARDEPTVAADELRSAVTLLETLEAPERLAAARSRLAGRDPGRAEASVLTPRELDVLRLVAAGRSNGQIAETLVVSEHTVHRHVANILTRLGEPTRGAAAARAVREGLI